ncbi:MAG TPA: HK97 gp10 family phage protein [Candidatus Saccharimonadales bacterium]|nr:HK97 gp10 family phage protein [Candidatus Saccharimonadales bacterium]
MIEDFTQDLLKQLQDYGKLLQSEIIVEAESAAKDLAATLKQNSPKRKKGGGTYAKGWRVKKQGKKFIVHNATSYQLTHLLEHGHALRNGGRARKFPHIKPASDDTIQKFLEALKRLVEEK